MAVAESRALVRQAEFAQRMGWHRSTVTRLKQDGRLVLVGRLVDVAASIARIEATGGMRFDVAERLAAERAAKTGASAAVAPDAPDDVPEAEKTPPAPPAQAGGGESRAGAQARKESAAADLLEMELEQKRGKLVPIDVVDSALRSYAAATRARMDTLPDQLAPMVAPITDLADVHAILAEHVRLVLSSIADDLARAEAALGAPTA